LIEKRLSDSGGGEIGGGEDAAARIEVRGGTAGEPALAMDAV
jgi:hypothetical protein